MRLIKEYWGVFGWLTLFIAVCILAGWSIFIKDDKPDCSIEGVLECIEGGGTIYFMPGTYSYDSSYSLICEGGCQ